MKQKFTASTLRQSFDRRTFVIGAVQGGIGLLLAARMGYIAVAENAKYAMEAESNRVNLSLIPPRRGWILDRNGAPLASNRADFRVDIIPERLQRHGRRGRTRSAELLELTPDQTRGPARPPRQGRPASSRCRSPTASTTTPSPRSACACPNCPASCRSAAFRAIYPTGPRSAT